MDLVETDEHFVLTRRPSRACPRRTSSIEVEDRVLTVSGERKAEPEVRKDGLPPRRARVRRVLALADAARGRRRRGASTASFDRGVLEVRIPKPEQREAAQDLDRAAKTIEAQSTDSEPAAASRGRGGADVAAPVFSIRTATPGSHARTGTLQARPRRGPHARVRPAGDQGRRQDARGPRGRRARLRHGAREHVPPVPRRPATSSSRASAACTTSSAGTGRSSPTPAASRSSRWATAPSPTRSRAAGPVRRGERAGAILAIEEEGVTFRSYLDGSEHFMGPETSMEVQAALRLRHRARVRRVHAVPRRPRVHRALDRAHAPLAGPLPRLAPSNTDRRVRLVYGIVQGGVDEDLRRASAQEVAARDCLGGIAIGGSLGEDKDADVRGRRVGDRGAAGGQARATCSASARSTTSSAASSSASTPSTARCPPGSAATAWPSSPTRPSAGASTSPRRAGSSPTSRCARAARARRASPATPAPTCTTCFKAQEQTAQRLLTIHNLAYLQRLMAELRDAIDEDRLPPRRRRPRRAPGWPPRGTRARGRRRGGRHERARGA